MSYSFKRYGVEDGAASSEVYCVIEDQFGYVWFGTDGGVSRFNGYEFTNYSVSDGLTDNTVFKLHEDYKGRIWYLTFTGGIGYFLNDSIHSYKHNNLILENVLKTGWISNLVVDSNETVKFNVTPWGYGEITDSGELHYGNYKGESILGHVILKENQKVSVLTAFSDSKRNSVFLQREGKSDELLNGFENLYYSYSFRINEEETFFAVGIVLGYFNADTILTKKVAKYITYVSVDEKGRIWLCLQNSGIEIYDNVEQLFNNEEPSYTLFEGFNVAGILNQRNGGVWLAVENQGIFFIYNYKVENYFSDKKNRTPITAMTKNQSNELFYSIESGEIYRIDSLGNHFLFIDEYKDVQELTFTEPNQLNITTFDFSKDPISKKIIQNYDIVSTKGRGCYRINENEYWSIAGSSVKHVIDGETVFTSKENRFFRSVFQDKEEQLWFGGNQGISTFEDGEIINKNTLFGDGFENMSVNKIMGLKNGVILIITKNHGLLFLSKIKDHYKSIQFSLLNVIIKDVYIDEENVFWLATNKGVFKLEFDENYVPTIKNITHLHGLPSSEGNFITGIEDRIYVGTNNGLAKFNKNEITFNKTPPPLYIKSIQVNETKLSPTDETLLFNANENDIVFSFVGLSYRNAGNIMYRYRLKEIDKNWQYTTSRNIRYPSLPPNEYAFLLSVSNEDRVWSEPLRQRFKIKLPFWKTWWFFLLVLFIFVGGILFLYFRHEKNKAIKIEENRLFEEQRRKIIEAKLIALRSQMNPHFTFNTLNAIQNVMINFSIEEALSYMSSFSKLLRKILEKSNEFYITIDEEIEMLKYYVELENLRFNNSIEFIFNVDDSISSDFTEIPSMIIQPFVENAIIHGLSGKKNGDKKIEISISQSENEIYCIIQDNGIGREKAGAIVKMSGIKQKSLGIKITKERLKLFDSGDQNKFFFKVIDCHNNIGEPIGTRVEITFQKND